MNPVLIIIAVIIIWFVYRIVRGKKIDKKYKISRLGGRAGILKYESNGKKAEIPWEMLGGNIDFVLYDKIIEWKEPKKEKFTDQETELFYKTLNSWAKESKLKYESEIN